MRKILLIFALFMGVAVNSSAQDEHAHHHGHAANDVETHVMKGTLGQYPMAREASGTAWQPDSTPHTGIHLQGGEWTAMVHGFANLIYDDQGGPRGDDKLFSTSMLMGMANRPLGPGTWGLKGMLSFDPEMGDEGYPLLLQTGETAGGHHLIDRQHPHDLFMELATTYSVPTGENSSVFGYFGFPGEPALGPPAFMHRFSGVDNPEAPISHHWLDSTHITFGVGTFGYIWNNWKVEGSVFTGREPDESRWNFDSPQWDSYSTRLSYNFSENWSAQVSYGWLHSPEELSPEVDQERITSSISYNKNWGRNNWQTTFAWGRNMNDPGENLDALLLESAVNLAKTHTIFGRIENTDKNELFDHHSPRHGETFNVSKASLGYIYDFPEWHRMQWGIGGLGSIHILPSDLDEEYGDTPTSYMLFARVKI
jgi:hypothetical protein